MLIRVYLCQLKHVIFSLNVFNPPLRKLPRRALRVNKQQFIQTTFIINFLFSEED